MRRITLSRLLSTAGPILIVLSPVAVVAQVASNTARVAAPAGSFETTTGNNVSVDNDALLAVIAASNDGAGPVNGANGERVITAIDRISKPGRRIYTPVAKIPRVRGGMGICILSTPKGLLSDRECRKHNVGGEILCKVG